MNILAKVSYKGTNYQGWQTQIGGNTIQDVIQEKLSQILNTPITIYGSGRTDSGVHAYGQYFNFKIEKDIDLNKLRYSLNSLLPIDIHINSLKEVDDDFHARFSAKGKKYQYVIRLGENDPFSNELTYNFVRPLDVELFKKAIVSFSGRHNFMNFTSKETDEDNFIRNIQVEVVVNDNFIYVNFTGDGFMRYMIRYMVGTALEIGEKRLELDFIDKNLDTKIRKIVSYKAPSQGLFLLDVIY